MSDLELVWGEQRVLNVAVTDDAGAAVPITGSLFYWLLKRDWLDTDAEALMTKTVGAGITITNGAGGLATITLTAADWAAIANEPARLIHGLTEKDTNLKVWDIDEGAVYVQPSSKATSP